MQTVTMVCELYYIYFNYTTCAKPSLIEIEWYLVLGSFFSGGKPLSRLHHHLQCRAINWLFLHMGTKEA